METKQSNQDKSLYDRPAPLNSPEYCFDAFNNGDVLLRKKRGRLPAMGWNSWNAFGSGNTEALTLAMAKRLVELELDKLGYRYVVLDDGCYNPERSEGILTNEPVKFPSGFRALADALHDKGLLFGMYNDIGTNLCAGAAVGTCGHEKVDAATYLNWGVDFIKVDNCYYPWDNATFSDATNARFTYAPKIRSMSVGGNGLCIRLGAVPDGVLVGRGAEKKEDYVWNIGTFDGTGPENTPCGEQSGELVFYVDVACAGSYELSVEYASGKEPGIGQWLQVAVGEKGCSKIFFDELLPETPDMDTFVASLPIIVELKAGENCIRLMNHRRQENTLRSYAELLDGFQKAKEDSDVLLSICEWGKTQPQEWGYKVGDSWRILNDICFQVGADGNPGKGEWAGDYTLGIATQYNKAVIMDRFSGLDRGWNDPDMMIIGLRGIDETMSRTHMTMWCMMNAPLFLGMDLREVEKGDAIWKIISNKDLIALNQDPLGVQAKRIYTSAESQHPDTEYIRDNNRVDILAKPLADGNVALCFLNLSQEEKVGDFSVTAKEIMQMLDGRISGDLVEKDRFLSAKEYQIDNLWTGETTVQSDSCFSISRLAGCDNVTLRISPK